MQQDAKGRDKIYLWTSGGFPVQCFRNQCEVKDVQVGDSVKVTVTGFGKDSYYGVVNVKVTEVSDEEITIILSDKGPGIPDVELAMQAGYSTAHDQIRNLGFGAGMGFPNMKKYTDELKVDTVVGKGTTVTMKVKL